MRQNMFYYRLTQGASWLLATFIFKRKIIRNEIKGKKGPFVVIANHQAALDFVNLIGITKTPMNFVISNSFYNSLPIKNILDKLGLIPKQQFQTTVKDMKRMKSVIESGNPLVIYPAGLMCEDGVSTPIPTATYKFLKWLNVDIYVARTYGTYFSMPKWTKGFRSGRTYLDVYKLFSKQEIEVADIEDIKAKTNEALLFDAYREQEKCLVKYKNCANIEGIENVLYMCPECKNEFTIKTDKTRIFCKKCGFEQNSDDFGFLHNKEPKKEIRYVSDWSKIIYNDLKNQIKSGEIEFLSSKTKIHTIDYSKHKFFEIGEGSVKLTYDGFIIDGIINGEETILNISIKNFASLPFSPGKYFEIQHGDNIYRCVLEDGKLVMKFINMIKIYYELNNEKVIVK